MDSSLIKRKLFDFFTRLKKSNDGKLVNFFVEHLLFRWLRDQMGFSYLKSAATGGAALGQIRLDFL